MRIRFDNAGHGLCPFTTGLMTQASGHVPVSAELPGCFNSAGPIDPIWWYESSIACEIIHEYDQSAQTAVPVRLKVPCL